VTFAGNDSCPGMLHASNVMRPLVWMPYKSIDLSEPSACWSGLFLCATSSVNCPCRGAFMVTTGGHLRSYISTGHHLELAHRTISISRQRPGKPWGMPQ
jgi:hypothetical protein